MEINTNDERSCILSDRNKRLTVREKWHDKEHRWKNVQSFVICTSFLALGANASLIGPTLLDLQILTHTDLVKASSFITAGAAGEMIGAALCGIIYEKSNPDLLIFLAVLMEGITTLITPFCSYYALMLFIRFATLFSAGIINICATALILGIWGTDGEQWMHVLHFCFALGGVLSPLYAEPFLASNNDQHGGITTVNKSVILNSRTDVHKNESEVIVYGQTDVKYAFIISSLFTIVISLGLLPFYFINRQKIYEGRKAGTSHQRQLPRGIMIFVLLIMVFFFMNHAFLEISFSSFLMPFMVREYKDVSKSKGAFAVAIYWACFASGRFLMVFLCKLLSPVSLLAMSVSLMLVAFTGLLVVAEYGIINALIGLSALVGFSFSAVCASTMSWTQAEILRVNGFVAGSFIFSCTVSNLINPLIFGHLMQEVDNMWFCYLMLGSSVTYAFLFLNILVYTRCYLNKRYKLHVSNVEVEYNPPDP